MRRPAAALAAALLSVAACRTAGPPALPAPPSATAAAVSAVVAARDEAWGQRRFKALYRGEVSPRLGVAVRGYLSLFWDGEALVWRTSMPVAGSGRSGVLSRSGSDSGELFPGRLAAGDVLAAVLGAPEALPTGEGAVVRGERVELKLPTGEGRTVLVSPAGEITGLVLPAGVRVELSPGVGVPRRIEMKGREGRAVLTLESYGPWPEGEEAPKE
ncbi:MAG: hypothetical protein KJ062_11580 [Thermoanaerobaculia bacterium]|nr:hypothetical protein [Thermoanaerobaculia bacterium]